MCTTPVEGARALADRLLTDRLIACANLVGPVESRYWWKGKIEEGREILLVLKTTAARCAELRARIEELHEYEVPEMLELPVSGGLGAYLEWVARECREGS